MIRTCEHRLQRGRRGRFKRIPRTKARVRQCVEVSQRPDVPGRAFTTREIIALEQETMQAMRAGQHRAGAGEASAPIWGLAELLAADP
jgi:hypothetical protein